MEHVIKQCLPTYDIVEKIGEGVYGSIYRIRDPYKERAVKIVPITEERTRQAPGAEELDSKLSRDFHAVRDYYEAIKGEGVVEINDFFLVDKQVTDKQAKAHLVILMQYCPVNLQDHVIDAYPLEPEKAVAFMRDLAKILQRLFQRAGDTFLVTDLKPSNLLLDANGRLLVGDLGGLKRISSVSTTVGVQFSPNWCAPEIVLQGASPDFASTIYAYGLVGYYIWEGGLPFENNDFVNRYQKMKDGGILLQHPGATVKIQQLIRRCLAFEPEKRPQGFDEILNMLENPWAEETVSRKPAPPAPQRQATAERPPMPKRDHPVKRQPPPRGTNPSSISTWVEPESRMPFVFIPGGDFTMGALPGDSHATREEKPTREIHVEPFWIGKYPVTQEEWYRVMERTGSHFDGDGSLPVEQVSWREAVNFVKRLTARNGNRILFSLPSEAQWEFAARSGGRNEVFPGGGDPDACAWHKDNSGFSTHPVGKKAPNGIGLFDMAGNVMEWCSDVHIEDAYRRHHPPPEDSADSGVRRVCRGGSWRLGVENCRTTARRGLPQGLKYTDLGFRVVCIR